MSRLEELQKAVEEADAAWDAAAALSNAAWRAAGLAFSEAREKLEDYVEEYGYEQIRRITESG